MQKEIVGPVFKYPATSFVAQHITQHSTAQHAHPHVRTPLAVCIFPFSFFEILIKIHVFL